MKSAEELWPGDKIHWGLKAGDLVRLKSGGPLMSVEQHRRADDLIAVVWFDDSMACRDAFDGANLVLERSDIPMVERPAEVTAENQFKGALPGSIHDMDCGLTRGLLCTCRGRA